MAMLSTSAQYRQMQQYHQRQCNHIDRFPSQQHSKPTNSQRPNMGSELLAKLEQAGKVPSRDKFRRMCCQTFLSTGGCPYNDRCVFLHDPRLQVESFRLRTVKNVRQSGTVKDTFYWPDMERCDVSVVVDGQGLPDAKQAYNIPEEFSQTPASSHHDRAVFSMWSHFVDMCLENNYEPAATSGGHIVRTTHVSTALRPSQSHSGFNSPAQQSPTAATNNASKLLSQNRSPQSITANLSSPTNPFHSPEMIANEIRGPMGIGGWNSHHEHDSAHSVNWKGGLETGSLSGPRDDIDMEIYRNKHLKGVWRLPTFITLAGATHDGSIPSTMKGQAVNGTDTSAAPPSTSIPPVRDEPFFLPLSSHNHHPRESHTKEPTRNHHQQQQRLDPRHLYSDSQQNVSMDKSVLREVPTPQQQQYPSHAIQRQNDDESLSNQNIADRRGNGNNVWGERDPIRGPQHMHHASIFRHREHARSEHGIQQRDAHHQHQNGYAEKWGNRHQVVGTSLKSRPLCYATPDPLSNCFLSYEPREIQTFPSGIGSDQYVNETPNPWQALGQSNGDIFGIDNMNGYVLRDQPFRCTGTYEEYSLESKRDSDRKISISHAAVGPGPLSCAVQGDRWNGSHQMTLPNPAKFLIHDNYLEEIPLPPSRIGSNTAWGESECQPMNSYSSDTKNFEINGGGWNLFGERSDSLHASLSDTVCPQLDSVREIIDTGNVWSNRLLRGDSEKKTTRKDK